MDNETTSQQQPEPRWQPLSAIDRRVAGVLAEKAKTTPDAYPMSLNAVTTGCNQKSNRFPVMKLDPDDVEESLDRLRRLGAVGLVEGYGRVSKYRHYLYEWLAVEKAELAVMAELLLRGPQTIGELRGRASRMEPIRDLAALQPVLASLKSKGLVIPLTREGRGHVVTHALYQAGELDRLKAEYGGSPPDARPASADLAAPAESAAASSTSTLPDVAPVPSLHSVRSEDTEALRREIGELRSQLAELRSDLDDLSTAFGRTEDEVRRFRDELGG